MERSEFKALIKSDDWQKMDTFLATKAPHDLQYILNGIQTDNDVRTSEKEPQHSKKKSEDLLPIFLAIINGSLEVFKVFVKYGATIYQTDDEHNWNIIHHLVIMSHHQRKNEKKFCQTYNELKSILRKEELLELLKMDDKDGLRPLELSIHASCMEIFNAIINTELIYVLKKEQMGLKEKVWYDITEYQSAGCCNQNRWSKSPLLLLMYCDKSATKTENSTEIFRSQLVKQWASSKLKCNIFIILLWLILRVTCIYCFYALLATNTKQLSYIHCGSCQMKTRVMSQCMLMKRVLHFCHGTLGMITKGIPIC